LSWIVAVSLKFGVFYLSRKWLRTLSPLLSSNLTGLLSGITELGTSLFCYVIVFNRLELIDILGFGAGAAAAEILLIAGAGLLALGLDSQKADSSPLAYASFVERLVASLIHIASRALLYLGVTRSPVFGLIALLGFSITDGSADYLQRLGWKFDNLRELTRYYLFIFIIAIALLATFLLA
jgi:hypothetical protein